MRFAVLLVLLLATNAHAVSINFWYGSAIDPVPDTTPDFERPDWQDFRISTSPTAYIIEPAAGGLTEWHASDGPNVAAFFADLTNGINNPITWKSTNFEFVMEENRFFGGLTSPPLVGFASYPEITNGRTDLSGFIIDFVRTSFGRATMDGVERKRYTVEVFGRLPEPSSALLLMLGISMLGCRYR